MNVQPYSVKRYKLRKNAYEFVSSGSQNIIKVVELQKMHQPGVFNLAMGDIINGRISFSNITNNKDTDVIMQTVAEIVLGFTLDHPDRLVFVTGDTAVKTRLYQRYLSNNLEKIKETFEVWGLKQDGTGFEEFEKGKNYSGFLVKRS